MRRIRTVAVFPTMFTLGNLLCGFFSIVVAARVDAPTSAERPRAADIAFRHPTKIMKELDPADPTHNIMLSCWLIFLAMVFDALDGHVARLSRTSSDFGAQLDSLCDVVTFGVAPGFLLVKMIPHFTYLHREAVWTIAAAYAACAALRLARFNVETGEDDDHMHFSGLPSPAAAASIAGFGILFYELRRSGNRIRAAAEIDEVVQMILPAFALAVGLLMVSRIPYPHVVNQAFRGQRSFGHVVALLFALIFIMAFRGFAVPIIGVAFVVLPPVRYFWQRFRRVGDTVQEESIF
jgi:CDP-diacylglycerol---serine O-phosphatidyltransferase